jgi:hypothetical protein
LSTALLEFFISFLSAYRGERLQEKNGSDNMGVHVTFVGKQANPLVVTP